jgi:hypothetical protein
MGGGPNEKKKEKSSLPRDEISSQKIDWLKSQFRGQTRTNDVEGFALVFISLFYQKLTLKLWQDSTSRPVGFTLLPLGGGASVRRSVKWSTKVTFVDQQHDFTCDKFDKSYICRSTTGLHSKKFDKRSVISSTKVAFVDLQLHFTWKKKFQNFARLKFIV